jgi:hypothetical protein
MERSDKDIEFLPLSGGLRSARDRREQCGDMRELASVSNA